VQDLLAITADGVVADWASVESSRECHPKAGLGSIYRKPASRYQRAKWARHPRLDRGAAAAPHSARAEAVIAGMNAALSLDSCDPT
jgi:hypothetical protein